MTLAFRADPRVTKALLVADMIAHREADRLTAGTYWRDGRGCAVGCSVETINRVTGAAISHDDHAGLAAATGIPQQILYLQDEIFERLPRREQVTWPERFYAAIPDGADLSGVWPRFAVWLLLDLVRPAVEDGDARGVAAIDRVVAGYNRGWHNDDPAAVAQDVTCAAACADAYDRGVACAAAYAAADAAYAAGYARAAARGAVRTVTYAAYAAGSADVWRQMAAKLLELIEEAANAPT